MGRKQSELVREGYPKSSVYTIARRLRRGSYAERLAKFNYILMMVMLEAITAYIEMADKIKHPLKERTASLQEVIHEDAREIYRKIYHEEPPV